MAEEDIITGGIEAFKRLLDFEYKITLGRKGQLKTITLSFSKNNFHHLAGLHYLKDRPMLNGKSEKVFNKIDAREIKPEKIMSSAYFTDISSRLLVLANLERILDGDFYFYDYDQRRNRFSNIKANYVIKAFTEYGEIYFFLAKDADKHSNPTVSGCSIILNSSMDYTLNQSRYAVLSVSKIMTVRNRVIIKP